MSVRLKICGVTRAQDLEACERLGVDAVGINLWAGSKRGLSLPEARALLRGRTLSCRRVGVFVDATPDEVARAAETLELDAVQLHGDAPVEPFAALGLPWVCVIRGAIDLDAVAIPSSAAHVLLDAHVPGFGGAGTRVDWTWAAAAVRRLAPLPVWLAGGIDPDNAAAAIAAVAPAGLDVATGAELPGAVRGEKDVDRIARLVQACRAV